MKTKGNTVKFAGIFTGCSFVGVFLLRLYAMLFFYNTPEQFLPGIASTIISVVGLAIVFLSIMLPMIHKFDKTIERLAAGEDITWKERQVALGCYKRVVITIVIGNIVGFIIGQVVCMVLDFKNGVLPYTFTRAFLIVLQAILIGAVAAMYESYILNFMMIEPRRLLKIENVNDFQTKPGTVSRKFLLIVTVTLLMHGVNMLSTPFYLTLDHSIPDADKMNLYLRNGLISLGLSFLYCGGLAYIATRELKKRINDTSRIMENLGANGVLSERINLDINDDMGRLASNINFFMDKFSGTIKALYREKDNVSRAASGLASTVINAENANKSMVVSVSQIEEENATQVDLIEKARSSADQMNETADDVKAQIGLQSDAVQKSSRFVSDMVESINDVAAMAREADELAHTLEQVSVTGGQSLREATDSIKELQDASNEVVTIVKSIQSISSKTNLLAMNAAIESAHAGVAGKGFAVVADEVRTLSLNTAKSAEEIQKHIIGIVEKVDVSVGAIKAAATAFKSINDSISRTSGLMQTINQSMEQQRDGAAETLTSTRSVVEAIGAIQELADKQSTFTLSMLKIMKDIVRSSQAINSAVIENRENSENMKEALSVVSKTSQDNHRAVESMERTISGFHM